MFELLRCNNDAAVSVRMQISASGASRRGVYPTRRDINLRNTKVRILVKNGRDCCVLQLKKGEGYQERNKQWSYFLNRVYVAQ